MSDDTITASDFTSAEASLSSEPAQTSEASGESSAPVDAAAPLGEATTQPAATETVSPSTEPAKAGPIPFDVHKTALENARQKAVAEWEQQYGWAKQVNPQEFQQVVEMARRASTDPIAYLQDFLKELQGHPVHGAQLKSLHAKALAAARGQATAPPEQEPQPDLPIQLEDGRVVHLYSAEQQAKREAFLQKQWLQSVEQKLQPLQQTHEQMQAAQKAAERQAQVDSYVGSREKAIRAWRGMDNPELLQAFVAEMQRYPDVDDPRDADLHAYQAYMTAVLPRLDTTARQAVLNDINRQAAASTVNPAHTTTQAPKTLDQMSIAEALQHVAAQTR